jgi:O-antigen/teichoic acid export membrane protein
MNKIVMVKNIVSLVLNFIALVIFKFGFYGAFYAWVSVTLLSAIAMAYMANRRDKIRLRFYPGIFKNMMSFGVKNYSGNIATNIWRRFDVYLINIFSGIAAVGYYSLAVTIRDAIWVLIEPVHNAAFAEITKLNRDKSLALTSSLTRHMALNCFMLSIIFIVGGVSYIKFILGGVYQASIIPLIILLVSPMGVGVGTVISMYLVGQMNKPNLVSIFAWINVGINALLCLSLVPKYGIIGAAVSSTLTCIIGTVLILMVFKRFSGYSIKDTILVRMDDILYYRDIVKKLKNRFLGGKHEKNRVF